MCSTTVAMHGNQMNKQQNNPFDFPDARGCRGRIRTQEINFNVLYCFVLLCEIINMARVCCCCQSTALLPPRSVLVSRPLVLHVTTASKRRQLRPPSAIQEHGSEVLAFAAAAALGGPSVARAVYDELVSTVNQLHLRQQASMIAEVRMHQLVEHL
jgi:hypothetical protein